MQVQYVPVLASRASAGFLLMCSVVQESSAHHTPTHTQPNWFCKLPALFLTAIPSLNTRWHEILTMRMPQLKILGSVSEANLRAWKDANHIQWCESVVLSSPLKMLKEMNTVWNLFLWTPFPSWIDHGRHAGPKKSLCVTISESFSLGLLLLGFVLGVHTLCTDWDVWCLPLCWAGFHSILSQWSCGAKESEPGTTPMFAESIDHLPLHSFYLLA